ncbi:MAG: hypothetical protein Q8875_02595 [Pigeon pea little leaf phytoplasma]|nr:hypothetical protein [Pigeon pea little leaf phytoplasma]
MWNLEWLNIGLDSHLKEGIEGWEVDSLEELMNILSRVGVKTGESDKLEWKHTNDKEFSIKSFLQVTYNLKEKQTDSNMYNFTKTLWKSLVPPKVELMTWFVILEKLNTREKLAIGGIIQSQMAKCVLCEVDDETVFHLFFSCYFA